MCGPVQSIAVFECLPTRGEARTLQRLPQHSGPSAAEEPPATPEPESSKAKKKNVNDSTSPGFHASASGRLLALLKEAQAGAGKDRLGLGQGLHLLLQGRLLHLAVCSVSLYQS